MRHHAHPRVLGLILLTSTGFACGAASTPTLSPEAVGVAEQEIALALDDWHGAAATADEERYFGHFATDGVFIGTDAAERWTVEAFREYARPHFERGRAWEFTASRRAVIVDPGGAIAWFDEDLDTENLGPVRGSGVMVRDEDGRWRIAHYVLSFTIPNDRVRELRDLLMSEPPSPTVP